MTAATTSSHLLPPYPPAWADKFGEDTHGIFAAFFVGKVEFEMRWIPPGSFLMGSPYEELGRFENEGPQVLRTVPGYWMGTTPVTQAQWLALREKNPSHFAKGGQFPVEQVNWVEAKEFAAELREKTGVPLHLPTECEWEYACRAGTKEALYTGKELSSEAGDCPNLDEIAWYDENSQNSTQAVGQKLPNAWGLHDMLGNVWEWCVDAWDEKAYEKHLTKQPPAEEDNRAGRVCRGGSWGLLARYCRCACRLRDDPGYLWRFRGFRLAAGQEPGAAEPL